MENTKTDSPAELAIIGFSTELTAGTVKAAMKSANAGSRDIWQVPIQNIRVIEGFNPRLPSDDLNAHHRWLADQIKEHGFYQHEPLSGYVAIENGEQVVFLTGGHNRYAGACLAISEGAQIEKLPMVVSERGTSMEDLTVALFNSNEGKKFTALENGIVAKRLIRFGWSESRIAKMMNMTPTQVNNLLTLVGASKTIRDMVQGGKVSATTAVLALRKFGDKATKNLEAMIAGAEQEGKPKATPKNLPGAKRTHFIKKQAVGMFGVIEKIHQDSAFPELPDDLREEIEKLIQDTKNLDSPSEGVHDVDPRQGSLTV